MRSQLRSLLVLVAAMVLGSAMAAAQNNNGSTFTCSSDNGLLHTCRANTDQPIQFVRQLSGAQCVQGQTYGIDRGAVWVTQGCRAEFEVMNQSADNQGYNNNGYYNQGTYGRNHNDRDRNNGYRDQNGNWHSRRHHRDRDSDRNNNGYYSQNGQYNRDRDNDDDNGYNSQNGQYNGPYNNTGTYNNGGYYGRGGYNNGGYVGSQGQHPSVYYGKYSNGKTTCSAAQGAGPVYCQTDGALSDATVINQNGRCQRGQTWDINPDGLWVADGCSAQFQIQR